MPQELRSSDPLSEQKSGQGVMRYDPAAVHFLSVRLKPVVRQVLLLTPVFEFFTSFFAFIERKSAQTRRIA